MSFFHLDRHLTQIDGATIFCPGCGQSYDTIRGSFSHLPPWHYPQPKGKTVGVMSIGATHSRSTLCRVDGNHLVAHLLRAQIAAAEEKAA